MNKIIPTDDKVFVIREYCDAEDVHPDCLPKYIKEFVEHEKDDDDYMELNIEHKFEYQSVITDEEKDDNNDKET